MVRYEVVTDGTKWALKRTRRVLFFKLIDFRSVGGYWWNSDDPCFNLCWVSEEQARTWYRRLTA